MLEQLQFPALNRNRNRNRNPPLCFKGNTRGLRLRVWFKAIALFRSAEMERMIERDPSPADLRAHKTWLAQLQAEGERLVTQIRADGGLPRNQARIKLSDVAATIEELGATRAQWHGEMTKQRKAELWENVFRVPPPRN